MSIGYFKKLMCLHMYMYMKRCLPLENSFPPENPAWCRKNESNYVISCCQDQDFCNAGKRLKLPQDRAKDQSGKHIKQQKNTSTCLPKVFQMR